jgi:hypothetical protein
MWCSWYLFPIKDGRRGLIYSLVSVDGGTYRIPWSFCKV